ncbi:MAG: M23 family metallopeptidase [Cryobacterium sp.]|nr:M23 family metallopeptidase [Oligoflexia bacterium]
MKKILFSMLFLVMLSSSCASGRHRRDVRMTQDRIPAKQSSYRIRGTDEVGTLSPSQKSKLRAWTYSWRWPTNEVKVTSQFGIRSGDHHDGVDLHAPMGTQVRAAGDGKVIYSASKIRGYGRMVVIRHDGKLSTIYAHNSKLLVKAGQSVRRGQLIALSGNTGHSTGPHVHFEVREGITAINPMVLLPDPRVANEANRRMLGDERRREPARSKHSSRAETEMFSQSSTIRYDRSGVTAAARVAENDGFSPKTPRK